MKVYENTALGILLGDELSFKVGPHRIDFEPSLLDMPGATFGNHLINAMPKADHDQIESDGLPRYTLAGMTAPDVKADDRALVRVTLTSPARGGVDYSTEQPDLVQVLKFATAVHSEMRGLDLPTIRTWRTTSALIVLEPGAKITFRTGWDTKVGRSLWEFLRRKPALIERRVTTTIYSYDGQKVTGTESTVTI